MNQSLYITPDAFERLRAELHKLLKEDRPTIVTAVNEAAAMGDRSENAEYIYGKKRLREIDRRVRFLQKRLQDAEVVDASKTPTDKVAFGLSVELEDEEGNTHQYKIVGPDDVDAAKGLITYNSPMGKALLGKKVGDEIIVKRPKDTLELQLIKIFFP